MPLDTHFKLHPADACACLRHPPPAAHVVDVCMTVLLVQSAMIAYHTWRYMLTVATLL